MTTNAQSLDTSTPRYLWWTLLLAALLAAGAVIGAPYIGINLSGALRGSAGEVTWLALAAGTFLSGCLMTWVSMSAPRRFSVLRGGIVGGLTALLSYPVVQFLADVINVSVVTDGEVLAKVTGLALLATGPMSIVLGVVIGMVASWALMRWHKDTAAIVAARPPNRLVVGVVRGFAAIVVVLLLVLAGAVLWLTLRPMDLDVLVAPLGAPSESYFESVAAYEAIRAQEAGLDLHERCPTTLRTHGRKTARVVVYFHGLTSCPAQADALAQTLFDQGYNVYLPRMNGHGFADPLTIEQAGMRAENLIADASQAIDIAQGLGEQVVIVGLSVGGANVSWLTQNRDDVDLAIAVAPFLGPHVVPSWAARAMTNLLLMLPNQWIWWNPLETVRPPEGNYAYARWSSHGLAQVMRLGAALAQQAERESPVAANIDVVLNAADVAINADLVRGLIASWRNNGAEIEEQVIPFARHLPHDVIDPREPGGDVDYINALIVDLIEATN